MLSAATVFGCCAASGATFTWSGSIGPSFSTANNWFGNAAPIAGSQLLFSGPRSNTVVSQDIGTAANGLSIDQITFDDTLGAATSYTINGRPLQIDLTSSRQVRQNSAADQTIAVLNVNGADPIITGTGAGKLTINTLDFKQVRSANIQRSTTISNVNGSLFSSIIVNSSASLALGTVNAIGTLSLGDASAGTIAATSPQSWNMHLLVGATTANIAGANSIAFGGTVTLSGNANRTLTINNASLTTLTGSVLINSGTAAQRTLTLAGSGDILISGKVRDNATADTSRRGVLAYTGTGTLTLTGVNDFSGGMTLGTASDDASTLVISNNSALGTTAGSLVINSGARLGLKGNLVLSESISMAGAGSGMGAIFNIQDNNALFGSMTLSSGTTVSVDSGTLSLSGNIAESSAGFGLAKTGPGFLLLSGSNSFSGGLQVGSFLFGDSGTVALGHNNAAGTGEIFLDAGAVLQGANGARSLNNALGIGPNTGTVTIGGASDLQFNSVTNLRGTTDKTLIVNNSGLTRLSGGLNLIETALVNRTFTISGSGNVAIDSNLRDYSTGPGDNKGGLAYTGTGTLTLTGTGNDYGGGTTIGTGSSASTVVIGSSSALGLSVAGTIINQGATLALMGNIANLEPIIAGGNGAGGLGVFNNLSGNNALGGGIAFTANSRISVAGGSTLTLAGTLSQSGPSVSLTKVGGGLLALSGSNTFTGNITINGGTVTHSVASNLGTGTIVNLDGGGALQYGGSMTTTRLISIGAGGGGIEVRPGVSIVQSTPMTGGAIAKTGAGTLEVPHVRLSGLSIAGGVLKVTAGRSTARTSNIGSLSIISGKWDLSDQDAIINYPPGGPSPLADIRSLIQTGYANGSWSGNGVTSSSAAVIAATPANTHKTALGFGEASTLGITTFSAQGVDDSSVLIRYTYVGDATLDGSVNTLDFNVLASNFNQTNRIWSSADFNYDGVVNALDFNAIATNFGFALAAPLPGEALTQIAQVVPEPMIGWISLCGLLQLGGRRRRNPAAKLKPTR